jgi:hypothetical protein
MCDRHSGAIFSLSVLRLLFLSFELATCERELQCFSSLFPPTYLMFDNVAEKHTKPEQLHCIHPSFDARYF